MARDFDLHATNSCVLFLNGFQFGERNKNIISFFFFNFFPEFNLKKQTKPFSFTGKKVKTSIQNSHIPSPYPSQNVSILHLLGAGS